MVHHEQNNARIVGQLEDGGAEERAKFQVKRPLRFSKELLFGYLLIVGRLPQIEDVQRQFHFWQHFLVRCAIFRDKNGAQ